MLLICRQLKWLMRRFASSQGVHKQRSAFTRAQTMCYSRGLKSLFLFRLCLFVHLCSACACECVWRCTSVSHGVGIKAWDDPFFNEQTLHFDTSLTRHYRSLGASALLIQHPEDPHAHSQALTLTQTPRFSTSPPNKSIDWLEQPWNLPADQWAFGF